MDSENIVKDQPLLRPVTQQQLVKAKADTEDFILCGATFHLTHS
jgi:hypothetical protein